MTTHEAMLSKAETISSHQLKTRFLRGNIFGAVILVFDFQAV